MLRSRIWKATARSVSVADVARKCRCARGRRSGETMWFWIDILHLIVVTRISIQQERKRNQDSEQ